MDQCPFCKYVAEAESDLIVFRTPNVFVVPTIKQRPLNRGHMLVVPTAHLTSLIDLDQALIGELYSVAARVSAAVQQTFGASGVLLFQNETIPGQVLHHIHIHVVPRREGDNFRLPDPSAQDVSGHERKEQAAAMRYALRSKTERPQKPTG
jgi:histidine triad (HIT) family protein